MTTDDVRTRVSEIVCSVLQIDRRPPESLRRDDLSEWDSLSHVEIMFSVEEEFGILLDPEILHELDSVESIALEIERSAA